MYILPGVDKCFFEHSSCLTSRLVSFLSDTGNLVWAVKLYILLNVAVRCSFAPGGSNYSMVPGVHLGDLVASRLERA